MMPFNQDLGLGTPPFGVRRSLRAGLFASVVPLFFSSTTVLADSVKPNIIFILADDLGYGDLGCYGQQARAVQGLPYIQTPRLDQLAAQGMRFTQFYASPSCAPTRCTLNTGFHRGHCAIRCNSCSYGEPALRTEDVIVAEMLKRANYRTCYLGKWHKGGAIDNDTPAYVYGAPQNKGFDESYVYMGGGSGDYYPPWLWRNGVKEIIPQNAGGANVVWSHDLFTNEALGFISRNANVPFYLHVAYTIPHANLECPSTDPYTSKPWPEIEKRFAAMITRMDTDVGRIADLLDQLGIGQSTLIIFSSDNGPQNKEGHDPEFFDSNDALRGIKFEFWEGGMREPFIARWTGHIPAGRVNPFIGVFYDFMPTAAEMAGVRAPGGLDGISILPTLLGNDAQQNPHHFLYWEGDTGGQRTIRMGDSKSPSPSGVSQLYNLLTDPTEQVNVASQYPSTVTEIDQIKQSEHRDGPPPVVPPVLTLVGGVSGTGSQYVLDFGTRLLHDPPVTRTFQVRNAANEYSNLMEGQIIKTGVTDPRLAVQASDYGYLVDGSNSDLFSVTLSPSSGGSIVNQSLVITGRKYGYHDPVANSPITLTITGRVSTETPGDCDRDEDVDQADFAQLQRCLSGTGVPYQAGCADADLTRDGWIDFLDVEAFLECMAGSGRPSPCAP